MKFGQEEEIVKKDVVLLKISDDGLGVSLRVDDVVYSIREEYKQPVITFLKTILGKLEA
jgi:hypothetical protein